MKDKIALVTGATAGIGFAISELLLKRGATVILTGRDANKGEIALKTLKKISKNVSFYKVDVNIETEVTALFDVISEKYKTLDFAVNNAGIANETTSLAQSNSDNFQQMINTNVLGLYFCLKAEIKMMEKKPTRINC